MGSSSQAGEGARVVVLDVMRCVLCTSIVCLHAWMMASFLQHTPDGFLRILDLSVTTPFTALGVQVDAFFALSGFLLARATLAYLTKRQGVGRSGLLTATRQGLYRATHTVISRVFRMWPAIVVALVLYNCVWPGDFVSPTGLDLILRKLFSFTLTHRTSAGAFWELPLSAMVTWSNSVDVQLGVLLSLSLPVLHGLGILSPWVVVLPGTALALAYRFVSALHDPFREQYLLMATGNMQGAWFAEGTQQYMYERYDLPRKLGVSPETLLRPLHNADDVPVYWTYQYFDVLSRCPAYLVGAAFGLAAFRHFEQQGGREQRKQTHPQRQWWKRACLCGRWILGLLCVGVALFPYIPPPGATPVFSLRVLQFTSRGLQAEICDAARPTLESIAQDQAKGGAHWWWQDMFADLFDAPPLLTDPQRTAQFLLDTACDTTVDRADRMFPLGRLRHEAMNDTLSTATTRHWVPVLMLLNPASRAISAATLRLHVTQEIPAQRASMLEAATHAAQEWGSPEDVALVQSEADRFGSLPPLGATFFFSTCFRVIAATAWAGMFYLATTTRTAILPQDWAAPVARWASFAGALTYPIYVLHLRLCAHAAFDLTYRAGLMHPAADGGGLHEMTSYTIAFIAASALSVAAALAVPIVLWLERPCQPIARVLTRQLAKVMDP